MLRNTLPVLALLCSLVTACDDLAPSLGELAAVEVKPPLESIPVGTLWGPCDLSNVDDADWWGCNGAPGVGLACLRPVSEVGLNICAPQTWDPAIDDDCAGVAAPFGLGVAVNGSAYCVSECVDDNDCAGGMGCSPASGFCAWLGE